MSSFQCLVKSPDNSALGYSSAPVIAGRTIAALRW